MLLTILGGRSKSQKPYCPSPPFSLQRLAMLELEIERIDERVTWRSRRL
jgi:hypothetical protein